MNFSLNAQGKEKNKTTTKIIQEHSLRDKLTAIYQYPIQTVLKMLRDNLTFALYIYQIKQYYQNNLFMSNRG
jgi:hypothetical protein